MGSVFQRLEVVLIGLILLIAGAVVAIVMLMRPPAAASYIQATPQPVATRAPGTAATAVPTPTAVSTTEPIATMVPAVTAVPMSGAIVPSAPALALLSALWPTLLLAVGVVGLPLAARRFRRRRMGYTRQNVSQLLATADAETRASNVRVMRDLAARGLLTDDLAAAAGIVLAQPARRRRLPLTRLALTRITIPRVTIPRVTIPRVTITSLRLPTVRLPALRARRAPRPITLDSTPGAAPLPPSDMVLSGSAESAPVMLAAAGHTTDAPSVIDAPAPDAIDSPAPHVIDAPAVTSSATPAATSLGLALPPPALDGALPRDALRDALADQANEVPELELPDVAEGDTPATGQAWTAEDRALAVASALAELWAAEGLQSPILALDTRSSMGGGPILITIDAHPDEEETLLDLPDLLSARHATWRASWRRELLEIIVPADGAPPNGGGPLIAPILTHGRGGATTRFFPLTTWRHLGLYGMDALDALHALLGSLLYSQPPAHLALAILDHGEIAPLYRDVAHLVALPDTSHATFARRAQAIGRGAPAEARPLLLVVVDPDDDELKQLTGLAARVQARPATPLRLLVAQTQPRGAGRELYAQLPALILGGGSGPITLLPGQGEWPKRGEARLLGRGMRVAGRAMVLDEVAIAQALIPLRRPPIDLPPVLWDAAAPILAAPAALAAPAHIPNVSESALVELDAAERRRRIAEVMARRRQALMDAEPAAPVAMDAPGAAAADVPAPAAVADESTAPRADAGTPVVLDAPAATRVDAPTLAADAAQHAPTPAPATSAPPVLSDATPAEAPPAGDAAPTPAEAPPIGDVAIPTPADGALDELAPPDGAAARRRAQLFRGAHEAGDAGAPPLRAFAPRTSPPVTPLPPSAAPERPSDPAPMQEPENGWPIGPAPLGRVAMADLMSRVVAAPAIVGGLPSEQGVTKNRLVEVLSGVPRAQARELAEILLAWFDQAGLLVEPTRPGRLRHPRALITTNLIEIAARLNATPCPDKGTVAALWAASNEGRN